MSDEVQGADMAQESSAAAEAANSALVPASGVDYGPLLTALSSAGFDDYPEGEDALAFAATSIGNMAEGIKALSAEVRDLAQANSKLEADKTALEEKLAAAEKAPRAKAKSGGKLRKVGPLEGDPLKGDELLDLVRSAAHVEVAFSDGKRELAHVPPREISGDAWQVTVAGLRLRADVTIDGSGMGEARLAGYGLFLDGELSAYRERSEVLAIGAGRQVSLAGDIVF